MAGNALTRIDPHDRRMTGRALVGEGQVGLRKESRPNGMLDNTLHPVVAQEGENRRRK